MSCGVCGKARQAGVEAARWMAKGFPLAEYKKRIDICRSCPSMKGSVCKECGCLMTIKARMATTKCPLGKWQNDA